MKNILYVMAVLLIIAWAIGFLIYKAAGFMLHVLLIVAVIAIIINMYKHKRLNK